ncbi:MAG TPA: 23S rRNA (adenine(2503)-C2)-methyltransferase, partial [Chloroflexi bacterium]|nr:23S rRNA (adenine(2503)-C2)-methyltransferase [Chloroflexota bacterium]
FQETLEKSGISCTIRLRRGIDIQAGCGQLAAHTGREGETRFLP